MKTRRLRLLMVDDAQEDIELFQGLFQETAPDIQFHSVLSAQSALTYFETIGLPDVILLDLQMPAMDGHQFLAHLKSQPALKHLSVVILTSSDHEADVHKAYHGLASAYLIKPTTYDGCREMTESLQGFWRHVSFPTAQNV
ncbi:response regulator [Deinococcus altitudinis]|uniref:response regulator n=1 Tax=Deinococcus altitudinis TaxID=468914 RepID=UPI003891D61A